MEGTERVLEAGVTGSWIDHRGQPQLINAVQTLEVGMLYYVVKQSVGDLDKPENGVVNNLVGVHFVKFVRKITK